MSAVTDECMAAVLLSTEPQFPHNYSLEVTHKIDKYQSSRPLAGILSSSVQFHLVLLFILWKIPQKAQIPCTFHRLRFLKKLSTTCSIETTNSEVQNIHVYVWCIDVTNNYVQDKTFNTVSQ